MGPGEAALYHRYHFVTVWAAWHADDLRMLTIYRDEAGTVRESASLELPSEVIWIDLLDPTDEEGPRRESDPYPGTLGRSPERDRGLKPFAGEPWRDRHRQLEPMSAV
jgi:hypothetical protein